MNVFVLGWFGGARKQTALGFGAFDGLGDISRYIGVGVLVGFAFGADFDAALLNICLNVACIFAGSFRASFVEV
jgi:hypothetical protein